jgi:hypothetical protein
MNTLEDNIITIQDEDDSISFKRKDIPEIDEYLDGCDDIKVEIERMKLWHLTRMENDNYYLIKYSCGTKLCNNVLVKIHDGKLKSVLLSEASMYQDMKVSTNEKYMAFVFGINEGNMVIRHDLEVVDISNMEKKTVTLKNDKNFNPFTWYLESFKWINDQEIKISIPNIDSFDFESLKKWLDDDSRETKDIELKVR